MTWQFNEPWPNIQCSNIIDYYGGTKLAYDFVKDAYACISTSLKYNKLFYTPNDSFNSQIYIINDKFDENYSVSYEIVQSNGTILDSGEFTGVAREDVSTIVGDINIELPKNITGGFSVILRTTCGQHISKKEYLMLIADKDSDVKFHQQELEMNAHSKNRQFINDIDGKRADYKVVIDYYNRCRN